MDLYKIIQELYEERKRLAQVIRALESLEESSPETEKTSPPTRRRRMSQQQRLEISLRMRKYWEARRKK